MMTGGERLFPIDDATWQTLDPLTAAGVIVDSLGRRWDPRKHPRGRDGKFIRTGGLFRIFKNRSSRTVYGAGEVQGINDDGSVNVKVTRVARGMQQTGVGRVLRVDPRQLAVLESKAHLSKARDPLPRPEDRRLPDADGRNIRLGDRVRLRDGTETTVERIDMNRGRILVRHPEDGRVMTPAAAGVERLDEREDDDPLVDEMRGRLPAQPQQDVPEQPEAPAPASEPTPTDDEESEPVRELVRVRGDQLREGDRIGDPNGQYMELLEDPVPNPGRDADLLARVREGADEYEMEFYSRREVPVWRVPQPDGAHLPEAPAPVNHEALLPDAPQGWTRSPANDQPGQFPMFAYENADGWRVEVTSHDGGQSHAFRVRKPDGEYLWPLNRGVEHSWDAVQRKIAEANVPPADPTPAQPEAPEAPEAPGQADDAVMAMARDLGRVDALGRIVPQGWTRRHDPFDGDQFSTHVMDDTGYQVDVQNLGNGDSVVQVRRKDMSIVPVDGNEWGDIEAAVAADMFTPEGRLARRVVARELFRDELVAEGIDPQVALNAANASSMAEIVDIIGEDPAYVRLRGAAWQAEMGDPGAAEQGAVRAFNRLIRHAGQLDRLQGPLDASETPDTPNASEPDAPEAPAAPEAPQPGAALPPQPNRVRRRPVNRADQPEYLLDRSGLQVRAGDRAFAADVGLVNVLAIYQDGRARVQAQDGRIYARRMARLNRAPGAAPQEAVQAPPREERGVQAPPGPATPAAPPAPAAPPRPDAGVQERRSRGQHLDDFIADFVANLDLGQQDQSLLDNWLFDDAPLAPEDARRIDGAMAARVRQIVGALAADELNRIGVIRGELRGIYGNPIADQLEQAGPEVAFGPIIDAIARDIPNLADLPAAQRDDNARRRRNARLALGDARAAVDRGDNATRDAAIERARVLFNLAGDDEREGQVRALQGAIAGRPAGPAQRPVNLFDAPPAEDTRVGPVVFIGREHVQDVDPSEFAEWGGRGEQIRRIAETVRPISEWHRLTPAQVEREAKKIFQGQFGGLFAKVQRVSGPALGRYYIEGQILDENGRNVGHFERSIYITPDDSYAYNALMQINARHQGKGFAGAFNRNAENFYIANGIEKVKVHAALDVGGFAWARNGFDWDRSFGMEAAQDLLNSIEMYADRNGLANNQVEEQIRSMGRRIRRAMSADNWDLMPTPFELSQIGWQPGVEVWAGHGMKGGSWHGVKTLNPNNRVYQQLIAEGRVTAPQPADANRGLGDPAVNLADVEVRDGYRPGEGGRVYWAARERQGAVRDARKDADGDWEVFVEFDDGEKMWMPGRALREPENVPAAPEAPAAPTQPREVDAERDNRMFNLVNGDAEVVESWINADQIDVENVRAILDAVAGETPIAENPDAMREFWEVMWENDLPSESEFAAEISDQIEAVFPEWRAERVGDDPSAAEPVPAAPSRSAAADAEWLAPVVRALNGVSKDALSAAARNPQRAIPGLTVVANRGRGVNSFNYIVTHNETGRRYIVKIDDYHDGANSERDAAELAREIGFNGAPAVALVHPPRSPRPFIVMGFAGEQQELRNLGTVESAFPGGPRLATLNLADDSDVVGMLVFDTALANVDRHPGNIMVGENADGKRVLLPIDNGGAFAPMFNDSYLDIWPQYHHHMALRRAVKDYIESYGFEEFKDSINRWAEKIRAEALQLQTQARDQDDAVAFGHYKTVIRRMNKLLRESGFAGRVADQLVARR